jgi:hypothetical protein
VDAQRAQWSAGGKLDRDAARFVGFAIACGVDPVALLRADQVAVMAVADALPYAQEYQVARDKALAVEVINVLARATKRG